MSGRKENIISEAGMNRWFARLYRLVENGKLFWPIQALIILIVLFAVIISGIEFTSKERIKVYENEEVKRYHVKKVSELPRKLEEEEAEKIAIEDDNKISIEDIRNRYFSYVISKIERVKDYPLAEQKKGHEGSVLLDIFINRSGKVRKVKVLRQAKYVTLTKAAIDSIKKAIPFHSFPERLPDEELIIRLKIRFFLN